MSDAPERVCLDLFAGLGGFSSAFDDADGWEVVTVDVEERFEPDIQADVLDLRPSDLPDADVVLAAPPCTEMSMANQPNPHWDGEAPDSPEVREAIALSYHAIGLIHAIDPDYWFLENPRQGKMDVVLGPPTAHVTYCQYGLDWQKPTNLWGNHPPMEYRTCSPGADCHQRAPGGWDTGEKRKHTRDPAERSLVPYDLSLAIREAVEAAYEGEVTRQTKLITDGGREHTPERLVWATELLVRQHGVDGAAAHLQERVVADDDDRAKAALSWLRREHDREVVA